MIRNIKLHKRTWNGFKCEREILAEWPDTQYRLVFRQQYPKCRFGVIENGSTSRRRRKRRLGWCDR